MMPQSVFDVALEVRHINVVDGRAPHLRYVSPSTRQPIQVMHKCTIQCTDAPFRDGGNKFIGNLLCNMDAHSLSAVGQAPRTLISASAQRPQ